MDVHTNKRKEEEYKNNTKYIFVIPAKFFLILFIICTMTIKRTKLIKKIHVV